MISTKKIRIRKYFKQQPIKLRTYKKMFYFYTHANADALTLLS